jgi:hypothetical protein
MNEKRTEKFKKLFKRRKKMKFYKIVSACTYNDTIKFITPYRSIRVLAGWLESDYSEGSETLCYEDGDEKTVYNNGIHVYTSWLKAVWRKTFEPEDHILTVIGYEEDFLAAGGSKDAVFKKIWIDPKQIAKAIRRVEKFRRKGICV